jgi:hypothetical protein
MSGYDGRLAVTPIFYDNQGIDLGKHFNDITSQIPQTAAKAI